MILEDLSTVDVQEPWGMLGRPLRKLRVLSSVRQGQRYGLSVGCGTEQALEASKGLY